MRFHGILLVQDEADILAQTLDHLLSWIDSLHIFDTGSTDGSWDIIQAAATRDPRINLLGQQRVRYENSLRAMTFHMARPHFHNGDWIARLDADELYHIPPPAFIPAHLRPFEARIYCQHYEFILTQSEAAAWESGAESPADRARPISDRRRLFIPDQSPELRLFRYRRSMQWPADRYEPTYAGLLARERIPILHYRSRDPDQLRTRCAVRSAAAINRSEFNHWQAKDWRQWVRPDTDPRILRWEPGAPLPKIHDPLRLPRNARRLAQTIFYSTGAVRIADRFRRGLNPTFQPALHPNPAAPLP